MNMMINAYVQLTNVIEHGEECYRDSDCLAGRCCGQECEGGPYNYYLLDDGEPCGADIHCQSGVCSTNSGACEATFLAHETWTALLIFVLDEPARRMFRVEHQNICSLYRATSLTSGLELV